MVSGVPNYFSSGAIDKRQNVFHRVYERVLDYFDHLHTHPGFQLPPFVPVQTFNDLDDEEDTNAGAAGRWVSDDDSGDAP